MPDTLVAVKRHRRMRTSVAYPESRAAYPKALSFTPMYSAFDQRV